MMCAPLIMVPFPSPGHRPFRSALSSSSRIRQYPCSITRPDVEGGLFRAIQLTVLKEDTLMRTIQLTMITIQETVRSYNASILPYGAPSATTQCAHEPLVKCQS